MTQENNVSEEQPEQAKAAAKKPKDQLPLWVSLWGWYGVLAIFGAYYASSLKYIDQDLLYQFLNLSGALGLAVLCFKKRTWQPFALNSAWSAIAAYAIYKLFVEVTV